VLIHVGYINHKTNSILKSCTLTSGNQLHIGKCLQNPRLIALNKLIGLRVNAAHAGDKHKITGPRAQRPSACGGNSAFRG